METKRWARQDFVAGPAGVRDRDYDQELLPRHQTPRKKVFDPATQGIVLALIRSGDAETLALIVVPR